MRATFWKKQKQRHAEVKREIASMEEELSPIELQLRQEKDRFAEIKRLREKASELRERLELAERRMDYEMIAEITSATKT